MQKNNNLGLDKIAAGVPIVSSKTSPDRHDKDEDLSLRKAEIGSIQERNADRRANRKLRSAYAKKVYWYLISYSGFCAGLLLLIGFKVHDFSLPETVLTVIVGSTAVSAIGLVGFVVNGLFKGN